MPEPVRADSASVSVRSVDHCPSSRLGHRSCSDDSPTPQRLWTTLRASPDESPRGAWTAQLRCAGTANGEGRRQPATLVIRDQLLAALARRARRRRLPRAGGRGRADAAEGPGHGDFTTNVALQLAQARWACRRATSPPSSWSSSRPSGPATSTGSRSPVPASSTSTSRPRGSTTSCGRSSPQGERLRPRPRARRPAHQPRVRVGQPHRARSTPAVGAGSRSATRSPTCSPRRAPRCTASTT